MGMAASPPAQGGGDVVASTLVQPWVRNGGLRHMDVGGAGDGPQERQKQAEEPLTARRGLKMKGPQTGCTESVNSIQEASALWCDVSHVH